VSIFASPGAEVCQPWSGGLPALERRFASPGAEALPRTPQDFRGLPIPPLPNPKKKGLGRAVVGPSASARASSKTQRGGLCVRDKAASACPSPSWPCGRLWRATRQRGGGRHAEGAGGASSGDRTRPAEACSGVAGLGPPPLRLPRWLGARAGALGLRNGPVPNDRASEETPWRG
jgi:hypothetical protein